LQIVFSDEGMREHIFPDTNTQIMSVYTR